MPRLVPIIANGWVDNVVIVQYTTGLFITSAISNTSPISTLGAVYSSIDSQVMLLLLTFSSSPTCVYNTNRVVSKAKLTTWGGCLGFPSTKFVINSIPVGTSYTHPQLSLSLSFSDAILFSFSLRLLWATLVFQREIHPYISNCSIHHL